MRKLLSVIISTSLWGCASSDAVQSIELTTEMEKSAYAVGYYTAMTMARAVSDQGIIDDITPFLAGFSTTVKGDMESLLLDEDELERYMDEHQQRYKRKLEDEQQEQIAKNLEASRSYLSENSKKEGVIVLESGLQYEVLTQGDGEQHPTPSDVILAHYHGTLPDGTVFDSSVERDQPISFSLSGVIQGWKEVIPMMSVGAKWRAVLPPELAYGEKGMGQVIEPYTTLTFEIEILDLNPEEAL